MYFYEFNKGYFSPDFARGSEDGVVELTRPTILATDAILTAADDIQMMMASFWRVTLPIRNPFLVIAKGVDEKTLAYLASLCARDLPICVVKAPGFGDRCREMLIDIATVTGGLLFPAKTGAEAGRFSVGELGFADRVRVTAEATYIYGGAGSDKAIAQRIEQIRRELEVCTSDYDREKLQERLEALAGQ